MSTTSKGAPSEVPEPNDPLQAGEDQRLAVRIADFWWVDLPCKLRPYSKLLWAAWSDGVYLTAWPRTAAILIIAVFVVGFVEGGTHWSALSLNGYGLVSGYHSASFAQMLPLMILAVVLGTLSANLGIALVIGFALGDFFWSGVPFSPWARELALPPSLYGRVPQIAAYVVFFLLASWPTTATKYLLEGVNRHFGNTATWDVIFRVAIQILLIYEWTYFAPFGVKQQWDCCMQTSPLDVHYFHHATVLWLVSGCIVASLLRLALLRVAARKGLEVFLRFRVVADPRSSTYRHVASWARALMGAVVITLLLLGFSVSLPRTIIVFVIAAGLLLARTSVLPRLRRWGTWVTRLERYPAVLRLAVAVFATYLITRVIMSVPMWSALQSTERGKFGPQLYSSMIGFVLIMLLLPNGVLTILSQEMAAKPERSVLPLASPVMKAGLLVAVILLSTKRVFAADCEASRCCFSGDDGLGGLASSAGIPDLASGLPGAGIAGAAAAAVAAAAKGWNGSQWGKGYRQGWRHGFRNGQRGVPAVTNNGPIFHAHGYDPTFDHGFIQGEQDGWHTAVPPATDVDWVTKAARAMDKAHDWVCRQEGDDDYQCHGGSVPSSGKG